MFDNLMLPDTAPWACYNGCFTLSESGHFLDAWYDALHAAVAWMTLIGAHGFADVLNHWLVVFFNQDQTESGSDQDSDYASTVPFSGEYEHCDTTESDSPDEDEHATAGWGQAGLSGDAARSSCPSGHN